MPKVHFVKKARKARPEHKIKVGDSYFWWKFRFGPMRISKERPERSQLTQSGFLSELWSFEDHEYNFDKSDPEGSIQSAIDSLQMMRDECEGNLDNMPEHLKETSDSGIKLQERLDNLQEWIDNLEGIDQSIDEEADDEEKENRLDEMEQEFEDAKVDID